MSSMMLLPAKPGTCPLCATKHEAVEPHNNQSLYYQFRFNGTYGRSPTWADAVAHCTLRVQEYWKDALSEMGQWTEPTGQIPIAEPMPTSLHTIASTTK